MSDKNVSQMTDRLDDTLKNNAVPQSLKNQQNCENVNIALVDRKFNSCKILQDSCKKVQFLQDSWMQWHSCKILARFLQDSCKKLCSITRRKILQDSCKILAIICDLSRESRKILQELNYLYTHYVLIIYAFHQKPSIINRYRKILMNFTTVERIL